MAFNLNDYEDVATLNKWFIGTYKNGRSDISVISHDPREGYILVQATLWRDANDDKPAASNIAFGSRETFMPNMKKWYVEDTASSALGRAIILLKGSNKTATQDDMKRVETTETKRVYSPPGSRAAAVEQALRKSFDDEIKQAINPEPVAWSVGDVVDQIGSKTPNEPPVCCDAGHMLKQGVSKGGKPYFGYVCKGKNTDHAKWAKMTANGNWYFDGLE